MTTTAVRRSRREATDRPQPFPRATPTLRLPGKVTCRSNHSYLPDEAPPRLDITDAMARLNEQMDAVMEETLEAEFERTEGKGCDRRERCVGEPFEIFSDAEAGEEEGVIRGTAIRVAAGPARGVGRGRQLG